MPYLGIFGLEFENNIVVIFEISALRFDLITKFCEKMKMSKFGAKNALFGYFGARILRKFSYLKSALSNLPNCKIS